MTTFRYYAPAIVWGIFIFILSTLPGKDLPQVDWGDVISLDKLVHITFYGCLTALILRGYLLIQKSKLKMATGELHRTVEDSWLKNAENREQMVRFGMFVAISCMAYGWFLEWFQENYCQDRMFDWFDGLANTIGAFGAWSVFIWRSRL